MEFKGLLILAPLAGITDTVFRLLCRENGADAVVTEMASAKGLLVQPARTRRYLEFRAAERPVGAQIYGADPGEMAEAAAEVARMGFDFLDINMGCPVRKVTGRGAGAALLANPRLAGRLVRAAAGAGIPVTAKIRSGFGPDGDSFLEVGREVFEAGAAAVTLHPRTRGQMFSGKADWGHIARLKGAFPDRVVIGNGDIRLPEDAGRMASETGCDAVMIGRAALGNPWFFAAVKEAIRLRSSSQPDSRDFEATADSARRRSSSQPDSRDFEATADSARRRSSSQPCDRDFGATAGQARLRSSSQPCDRDFGATAGQGRGPAADERRATILRHGEEMHRRHGRPGILAMRKHLAWYSRGLPGASAFRAELVSVDGIESFRAAVGRLF